MIKVSSLIIFFFFLSLSSCNNKQVKQEDESVTLTLNKFLTEQEGYVKIQMTQLSSGHLSLSTNVNKVKGRFILDTGSSSTIIDIKHRKKFRLVTRNTQKIAKTAGGSQLKMKVSDDNIFDFEQLTLRNVKVSLVRLNHINYSFKRMGILEVDGIIGADLLNNREAIIDYSNLILYLKK